MSDIRLERDLNVSVDELWDFVTTTDGLLHWWGPDGFTIREHTLDFTRLGPWFSIMQSPEGNRFKVSGEVTHVRPKMSVGFTWAWHDEEDERGPESHVTLSVSPLEDERARLILDHMELADAEAAQRHYAGWISCLKKLERQFAPA
ncbi:hypothetical protein DEA8626_03112 [Defluviimonas aquaemixtae]|uniref:Activator of Hsp90 ATPase homologue 1/2-like C-terminal domain-containing protein n=1 Tax=Albidovulum aquaemixtae TaxID=1542388 RepID=A0A2R8BL35_9RHOB|nr:SRPBCC domain-containing protein [Defluviimonas aquaemixtae]SPH24064.1 hypothetical protein DEA8626_03112 [Defluviimonas aquaemixtae]